MRPMVPARKAMSAVLGDLGFERGDLLSDFVERWEEAVGREVASHCRPQGLRGHVLEVRVESSVWCHQLQYRKAELLEGIRRLWGARSPGDLYFSVGRLRS